MNSMTKWLVAIFLMLSPALPLWAQPERVLSQQLVRIVAYAFAELQKSNLEFYFDAPDGLVAHIYANTDANGVIELYRSGGTLQGVREDLLLQYDYNLTSPELIDSIYLQAILPAHFRGEMGPMLIVYHALDDIKIIWYTNSQEHLIMQSLSQTPLIGYLGGGIYQIVLDQRNRNWQTFFFKTQSPLLSQGFPNVLAINTQHNQVVYAPENAQLRLGTLFELEAQSTDGQTTEAVEATQTDSPQTSPEPKEQSLGLDIEDFDQSRPLRDVISSVHWDITDDSDWGHLVVHFAMQKHGSSRAYYHNQSGLRLYFR